MSASGIELEAADRFRIGDGLDRGLRQVGGDARFFLGPPEAEQPEPRHQRDTRQWIERLLDAADARIVAGEIGLVVVDERRDGVVCSTPEVVELAVGGGGQEQRPVLGADGVVGRHHAGLAIARDVGAVDEIEHGRCRAEIEDEAPPRAFGFLVLEAGRAAQHRRNGGARRDRLRQLRGDEHRLAIAGEPFLGAGDQRDHPFIGLARGVAEGEDAVLVQDQSFDAGRFVEHIGGRLRERKARHDVGHDARARVIDLGADRFAVRLIDQAQDRGRMGVVDEFVRQEGVQQRLDRRIGRRRIEQVLALDAHHVFVAEFFARAQLAQAVEPHRRQPGRLDIGHVGARALDADDAGGFAEQVGDGRLHRRVAAAMQHQLRIAPEQACRVHAQGDVGADAVAGVAIHRRLRVAIDPGALHGMLPPSSMRRPVLLAKLASACATSRSGAAAPPRRCPRFR